MAMDIWYELRLLEMSDLNAAADELLREADAMSRTPDGADDEEQQRSDSHDDPDRALRESKHFDERDREAGGDDDAAGRDRRPPGPPCHSSMASSASRTRLMSA